MGVLYSQLVPSISHRNNCVATIWGVLLECVPYWDAFLFLSGGFFMNNIKKSMFHLITLVFVIFTLLSLLIPLVSIDMDVDLGLLGKISQNSNITGFDFITEFGSIFERDWMYIFTGFVCLGQLIISAMLIIVNLLVVSLSDETLTKKIYVLSIIICTFFTILFMVGGFLLFSDIKNMSGVGTSQSSNVIKISTLSFIPLIVDVILILAFSVLNIVNAED